MRYSEPAMQSKTVDLQALKREKMVAAARAFAKAKAEGRVEVVTSRTPVLICV